MGVEALVAERRPDLVVVSGDLTQRARADQFRDARRFLEGLGAPFLAVPGNHDVPMYRVWERLLDRYGAYRRHFSRDLEPGFRDAEMEVAGFNTAFNLTIDNGRFTRGQLAGVGARFGAGAARDADRKAGAPAPAAAGVAGREAVAAAGGGTAESAAGDPSAPVRIAIAHHPLAALPELMGWRTACRSDEALAAFAEAGVDLVLSGHVHVAAVGLAPNCPRPLWLVHSGTSTSRRGRGTEEGRNSCNWIVLDAGPESRSARVEQLVWSNVGGRFEVDAVHDCALA